MMAKVKDTRPLKACIAASRRRSASPSGRRPMARSRRSVSIALRPKRTSASVVRRLKWRTGRLKGELAQAELRADDAEKWFVVIRREIEDHFMPSFVAMHESPPDGN
jgi:hypothetical protein